MYYKRKDAWRIQLGHTKRTQREMPSTQTPQLRAGRRRVRPLEGGEDFELIFGFELIEGFELFNEVRPANPYRERREEEEREEELGVIERLTEEEGLPLEAPRDIHAILEEEVLQMLRGHA